MTLLFHALMKWFVNNLYRSIAYMYFGNLKKVNNGFDMHYFIWCWWFLNMEMYTWQPAGQARVPALTVKSLKRGTATLCAKNTWQMRNEFIVMELVTFVRLLQVFSILTLLTLGAEQVFVVGAVLCRVGCLAVPVDSANQTPVVIPLAPSELW